jgi:hydroxymethylpyrimidine/phosphomethylpyrimidine kinase
VRNPNEAVEAIPTNGAPSAFGGVMKFPVAACRLAGPTYALVLSTMGAARSAFVVCFLGSMTTVALTIAGSDSSGGAGIQADLKTFAAFAVFGTSAITAITAQNTRGVSAIANLDPAFVAAQIDAVADDFTIAAAKTGMLSRAEIIAAVANRIRSREIPNLVVDPVMVAASGGVLLERDAITMMRDVMLSLATVVTPNLREASSSASAKSM